MTKPIEMITETEWEMMDIYRDYYGACEDSNLHFERKRPLFDVLSVWNSAKRHLFKWLGEKLIYTEEIKFVKSEEQMYDDFDTDLFGYRTECYNFVQAFHELFRPKYHFSEDYQKSHPNCGILREVCDEASGLLNYENLTSNLWSGNTLKIPTPEGKFISVYHGSKVSKALQKIAEAYNLPNFEDFRIKHSQILNNKELTGILTLSIHPMDYMTMSDNNCGWESCMSWQNGGDYRQGTIEMMNSPSVIVAYLDADTPFYPTHKREFAWSNKKWRQLFICDEQFIVGVKGYPYNNSDLTKRVLEVLKNLAKKNLGWDDYTTVPTEFDDARDIQCDELNNFSKSTRLEFDTCHMYNDFGRGHYAYLNKDIETYVDYTFSGESQCIWCGNCESYDVYDNSVVCESCMEEVYYCDECGCSLNAEERFYHQDQYYCDKCYKNILYDTCTECGAELERRDEFNGSNECYTINFVYKNRIFNFWKSIRKLCPDCLINEPIATTLYYDPNTFADMDNRTLYVKVEDLTNRGKEIFDTAKNAFNIYRNITDYDELRQTMMNDFNTFSCDVSDFEIFDFSKII